MSKKLLLVDDSTTALMFEKMILGVKSNYELFTAVNGEEAIRIAVEEAPDLILMDLVMPRKNGFEACRELRAQESTAAIPIILLTTRSEEDCIESGYECGCNDYLTKPIEGEELLRMVEGYLGE